MDKKKNKKNEQDQQAKSVEATEEMEKTIWTVRVGTQILYRAHLEGRTNLIDIGKDESEKVDEVLSKAIGDVAKILEKRTTQHKLAPQKEQITRVDAAVPETNGEEELKDQPDETEKESKKPPVKKETEEKEEEKTETAKNEKEVKEDESVESDKTEKESKKPPVKKETEEKEEDAKKDDAGWNSIFGKLKKS